MSYYAEIYPHSGRPTGKTITGPELDLLLQDLSQPDIELEKWRFVGDNTDDLFYDDDEGFTQFKR